MGSRENLVLDGLQVLSSITVEELERRVDWLEKALNAYKTILIVRRMMAAKPEEFELPKEWNGVGITPGTVPSSRYKPRRTRVWPLLEQALRNHPEGVQIQDIALQTGLNRQSISSVLSKMNGLKVERVEYGVWRLRTQKDQTVIPITGT